MQTPLALEPDRDWSLGFITGHRVRVVVYVILTTLALYVLQNVVWPNSRAPQTLLDHVWSWGSLLWIAPAIYGIPGLIGMLMFRHPRDLDDVQAIPNLVSWRIVSRGTNREALLNTIRRIQTEMQRTPLFPYVIEVATDTATISLSEPNDDVRCISIPRDYRPPNGSRFKARALHYAMLHSELPDNAWIVHLDEETRPTASGIKGICKMVQEEEKNGRLRIGQGAILYHREWKRYPFLTLADNSRTGSDFGLFHLQHRLGVILCGFHGSYIVVRNDIEKATGGFDFGPRGDITEDAWWAMKFMGQGFRSRWVEGYLEEQSTQSLWDFILQRRRWFQGLVKVVMYAPTKLRWRASLGLSLLMWTLTPPALLYTIAHLFYGFQMEPWVQFFSNFSFASFMVLYLLGLKANLDEHPFQRKVTEWVVTPAAYALQVVFFLVFSLMESLGPIFAVLRPDQGFHVVKK